MSLQRRASVCPPSVSGLPTLCCLPRLCAPSAPSLAHQDKVEPERAASVAEQAHQPSHLSHLSPALTRIDRHAVDGERETAVRPRFVARSYYYCSAV